MSGHSNVDGRLRLSGTRARRHTHCARAVVLRLQRLLCHTSLQTSDATLELAVLGGVDERVDAAVGEHQHHGDVVEPAHIALNKIWRQGNVTGVNWRNEKKI